MNPQDFMLYVIWGGVALALLLSGFVVLRGLREKQKPGTCECGHKRCTHRKGKGHCHVMEWEGSTIVSCDCQWFIPKEDDRGGNNDNPSPAPGPLELELERWFNQK